MDAKQLLSILEKEYSDENVEMAIAWLKTKKPTNKSASRVLQKIFNHRKMYLALDLLDEWSKAGSWNFINTDFRELQSLEVFNWVVDLLNANPGHSDAGELWVSLLVDLRHESLEPGAIRWLQSVNPLDEEHAPLIVSILLEQNQEEWLVSIAKQLLKKQIDEMLLVALIEFVGDEEANSMGVEFLESDANYWLKKGVVTPMYMNDFEKNQQLVSDLLKKYAHVRVLSLLKDLSWRRPKSATIVCEWLEQNFESESAQEYLEDPPFGKSLAEAIPLIWSWFRKAEKTDANLEIFLRLMMSERATMPDDARAFILEWIKQNPKHTHFTLAKRTLSTEVERIRLDMIDSNLNVDTMETKDVFTIIKLLRLEKSLEAISLARKFIEKFTHYRFTPGLALELYKVTLELGDLQLVRKLFRQVERLPLDYAIELYKITSDRSDLLLVKKLFPEVDRNWKIEYLSKLIELGDDDSLVQAIEILSYKRLYRACDRDRNAIGKLLLTILPKVPNNPTVLERAEEWLRIKRDKYEREMADQLSAMLNLNSIKSN